MARRNKVTLERDAPLGIIVSSIAGIAFLFLVDSIILPIIAFGIILLIIIGNR